MMHTYLDQTIYYELVQKNRKSVAISIDMYGRIEVSVPKGTPENVISAFLESKWAWILQNMQEIETRKNGHTKKKYDQGEEFLYLGAGCPVQITEDPAVSKDSVVFSGGVLQVCVKHFEDERIQKALKRFYYKECKRLTEKRIRHYQSHFKMKPQSISITDNSSTWGTCNSLRQLTFNWKLAMAPPDVIDYVVVHELCHMVHLNHDRSFWRLVGSFLPDYEEKQRWLALSSWKMLV